MTLLDSLGNSLLAADRLLRNLRSASRAGAWVGPVTGAPTSINLVGDTQTITFADVAETHPIVHAVVAKLVRNLVTLGVGVYRRDQSSGRLERVYDTDLEQLLYRPAPGCGLVDLLQWIFLPALVEGNSLTGKYRSGENEGRPTNIIPLDWRYLSAFAQPGGPVEWWMSTQLGEPRVLQPSEVIHVAWQSPTVRGLGVSPLRALGATVRVDDAAQRFQQASLANAARPSGALVFPPDAEVTPEEREKLREQVRLLHGGVDNAFRVAVLSGGLEWRPMSFSAAQAELDATRLRNREEICVAYDVRWSQIADPPSSSGFTDVDQLARDFHRTLRPWATLAESALQRQLIDPEPGWQGLVVRFDFADLLRGSRQEELNAAVHAYVNGLAAIDESRSMVDLPPIENLPADQRPLVPHAQLQPGDGRALPPSTDPNAARQDVRRDRQS